MPMLKLTVSGQLTHLTDIKARYSVRTTSTYRHTFYTVLTRD